MKRAYCRRYGLNPMTAVVPRSELIEDAAFTEWEAENGGGADRSETLLSAIFYCVRWIAWANGFDFEKGDRFLWDASVTGPRKPTEWDEVREKEESAESQKRFFEGLKRRLFNE